MARALAAAVLSMAALLAAPARAADVQYQLSARSELRTRSLQPGSAGAVTAEWEVLPVAGVQLGRDDAQLSVSYLPSLLLRPASTFQLGLLQRGRLTLTKAWERATASASADGAWGVTDVSALRPGDALPAGSVEVATAGVLPYTRLVAAATLDVTLTQRLQLSFGGSYQASGTRDAPAGLEFVLPLQWGPQASAALEWSPDAQERLSTRVQATDGRFSFGQHNTLLQATQGWRHTFTTRTSMDLFAGAALLRADVPEIVAPVLVPRPAPGLYVDALPVASAAVTHRLVAGGTVDVSGTARLVPFADRYTGNVYERVEVVARALWSPGRTLQLSGGGGGGWAVPVGLAPQLGDRIVYGDGQVAWTASRWLALQASARVGFTEQRSLGVSGWQWLVGLTVTARNEGAL